MDVAVPEVDPVHGYPPPGRVDQPRDHPHRPALARTHAANQGNSLAGLHGERQIVEDVAAETLEAEGHPLELDAAPYVGADIDCPGGRRRDGRELNLVRLIRRYHRRMLLQSR